MSDKLNNQNNKNQQTGPANAPKPAAAPASKPQPGPAKAVQGASLKAVEKPAMGKTTAKTTEKGPHGGGNKFNQMKMGGAFAVHNGIPGTSGSKGKNSDKK